VTGVLDGRTSYQHFYMTLQGHMQSSSETRAVQACLIVPVPTSSPA